MPARSKTNLLSCHNTHISQRGSLCWEFAFLNIFGLQPHLPFRRFQGFLVTYANLSRTGSLSRRISDALSSSSDMHEASKMSLAPAFIVASQRCKIEGFDFTVSKIRWKAELKGDDSYRSEEADVEPFPYTRTLLPA